MIALLVFVSFSPLRIGFRQIICSSHCFFVLHFKAELASLEVDRERITLAGLIGRGQFGVVYEGTGVGLPNTDGRPMKVAVKLANDEADPTMFNHETLRMHRLTHAHIVRLLAVCTTASPPFAVLELMSGGDLKHYLGMCRTAAQRTGINALADTHLLKLTKDVSSAFAYMQSQGCVHRDLAARNVLLDSAFKAKLADFGTTVRI
jgi:serine/threonine protein kinase